MSVYPVSYVISGLSEINILFRMKLMVDDDLLSLMEQKWSSISRVLLITSLMYYYMKIILILMNFGIAKIAAFRKVAL
jgi:hypothetical protein